MQLDQSLPERQEAQAVLAALYNDMRASCQLDKASQAGRIAPIESPVAQVPSIRRCTVIKRAIDVEQFKINSNFIIEQQRHVDDAERQLTARWRMQHQQWHTDQVKYVEVARRSPKCGLACRLSDDARDSSSCWARTISVTAAVPGGNRQRTQGSK